jgi:uncharacterized membrane protein
MGPYQFPEDRDSDNPYAPPQSSSAPTLAAGMPFTVNDVFQWSWAIFSERMRACLSIFWGAIGINLAASILLSLVQESTAAGVRDPNVFKAVYILCLFASFVIQAWLTIGMTLAMLKIARGEHVTFENLFRGGPFLLTALLAWVVHKLLIAVPIVVATGVIIGGIVMMENQSGVAAFVLFLVVSSLAGLVFIVLAARISMYYYLVIDRHAGVFDSLLQSWRLCRNQVGTITLVYFVQFAVFLVGLLACVVGLVFALPLISLLETVTYLALAGGATSGEKLPRVAWEEDT